MNRKTLTALAVLGLLIVVAAVVLRQPEKGQTVGERPRPVPKLAAGSFDTLTVTKGTSTTTIKKDGDKYKIVAPGTFTADENVAKQAFEAIEKLAFGTIVSDQKAKHTEFELDDKALKVVVKKGEQPLTELLVGKSVGGNTLVRVPGKDEVWQGLGSFKYNFDRDTAAWRDKTITKFTLGDAETIELKSKNGAHASLKKGAGDQWSVTESSVKIDKLDGAIPTGIVSALSSWVTNDFSDETNGDITGLTAPKNTVTVKLKDGKAVTVLIGKTKGVDDVYVKTADAPQVYLVKRYNVDRIDKTPMDLRDKTVCDLVENDMTEIAVSHDKESFTMVRDATKKEWKVTKPAGITLDPSKATNVAGGFKEWKATGFAEDQSGKANGLAKPKAVVTAKAGKKSCQLKVGDETADKGSYIVQSGPDVYLLAKWSVDRVMPKIDDLKKK